MNIKDSTKKTILAMVLGLGIASASGMSVHAIASDTGLTGTKSANDGGISQVQSISDSVSETENVFEKFGGCGMSCSGCSVQCF